MKPAFKYILLTAILFLHVSISKAQNRILSLEDGISLLGISENQINSIVNRAGYSFDNRSDNIIAYSKYTDNGKYYLTIVYRDLKVSDISWTENGDYLPMYNNDIVANMGFVKDKEFDTGEAQVFSYKNYSKNLIVSFTWRYVDDRSHFLVTIGKFNYGTKTQLDLTSNDQNSSAHEKTNKSVGINSYVKPAINYEKLNKRDFIGGYISQNDDKYQNETKAAYKIQFYDPYSARLDTQKVTNDSETGVLTIADSKTGKIFKKYYVVYLLKQSDGRTTTFAYKILNQDQSGVSALDLIVWEKPHLINKTQFSYSLAIIAPPDREPNKDSIFIWCKAVK